MNLCEIFSRCELLRYAGPYLGAVATSFGLIFIWWQIRLNRKSSSSQARASIYQLGHSVMKIFIEKPEFRAYFYTDHSTTNLDNNPSIPPDERSLLATAEMLIDYFEHIYYAKPVIEPKLYKSWLSYIKNTCHKSNTIQRYLEINKPHYESSSLKIIQKPN